jgi:hypothetical protein
LSTDLATASPSQLAIARPITNLALALNVSPSEMLDTFKSRIMPAGASDADLLITCAFCSKYELDPLAGDVYVIPGKDAAGRTKFTNYVSFHGWVKIINRQPTYDGIQLERITDESGRLYGIRCTIFRKDLSHPVSPLPALLKECNQGKGAWTTHPERMLEITAIRRAAKLAFGIDVAENVDAELDDASREVISAPKPEQVTDRMLLAAATESVPVIEQEPEPKSPEYDEAERLAKELSEKSGGKFTVEALLDKAEARAEQAGKGVVDVLRDWIDKASSSNQ